MNTNYTKTYSAHYRHSNGRIYVCEFRADTEEEAEKHLRSIRGNAEFAGEVVCSFTFDGKHNSLRAKLLTIIGRILFP